MPATSSNCSRLEHCVADALTQAVVEAGKPALTAYHQAKLQGRKYLPAELLVRK
jgi:hypothetical protein